MSVYNNSISENNNNDDGEMEEDEEELDPRIQLELERLNKSCADINLLENELDEAKSQFISSKNKQLERLEYLQKKYGSSILKAKPYYESLAITEKLQIETLKATHEFQKTNSLYKTAKETLMVAENSLGLGQGEIPSAWQEHLSLTITKINLSKEAADRAEKQHKSHAAQYQKAEQKLQNFEKDLKNNIKKSQLYYDEKTRWNIQMETRKAHIHEIEQTLMFTKKNYKEAMANLSLISEEIHNRRKLEKMIKANQTKNEVRRRNSETETNSISNESQTSSDTETKKIKIFLNLYNLTLPEKNDLAAAAADGSGSDGAQGNSDSTTKTYDELKNLEASEYISLGRFNSTASNSRSTSPSNSLENDIEWNKQTVDTGQNITNNDNKLLSVENNNPGMMMNINNSQSVNSYLSSNTNTNTNNTPSSYSNSPRDSNNELAVRSQFYANIININQKTPPPPPLNMSDNSGISSLTLKSNSNQNHQKNINKTDDLSQKNKNELNNNLTATFKSNLRTLNSQTQRNNNKNSKMNETPLLSNLLLQHSARF